MKKRKRKKNSLPIEFNTSIRILLEFSTVDTAFILFLFLFTNFFICTENMIHLENNEGNNVCYSKH